MAGIMTPRDEGTEVTTQQVPSIDPGVSATAPIVTSAHVSNEFRANGVNYNTNESTGTDLDTGGYPAGTAMTDSTPTDDIN